MQGDYACYLSIEKENGVQIVASGEVYIGGPSEVVMHHGKPVPNDHRRVSVTDDIDPSAPLPCPEGEYIVVCQAMHTFVLWPVHLIKLIKVSFFQ